MDLKKRFEEACREARRVSKEELHYHPTLWDQRVRASGCELEAAKAVLATGGIRSGLRRLLELGRLDLSLQFIVLDPMYVSLFTYDQRKKAWEGLKLVIANPSPKDLLTPPSV